MSVILSASQFRAKLKSLPLRFYGVTVLFIPHASGGVTAAQAASKEFQLQALPVKSPKGELECGLASAKASRQFPTLVGVLLLNKQLRILLLNKQQVL